MIEIRAGKDLLGHFILTPASESFASHMQASAHPFPWEISLYNPISPCCQHILPDIQFPINIIVFLKSILTN